MLGIVSAATWGTERIAAVKPTQTISLSGYEFSFDGLVQRPGPNYNCAGGKVYCAQWRRADRYPWSPQSAVSLLVE